MNTEITKTLEFVPAELIKKKRNGHEHTNDELQFIVEQFVNGGLPDYQMSAWLMAVYFQGMTSPESSKLTELMMNSGRVLDFSYLPSTAVDKHSTGGVGDKTSMILAPLVAAAGVPVPMIAGRGLGHTGGTLDKLEAIPGFRVGLTLDEFKKQIENLGVAIIGQTKEICPADKQMYALRDVTGTIESLPLICASIMSKKLAEGIGGLVLDVKYGTGAFMKTLEDAKLLADKLMAIGTNHKKRVATIISNMDQPLGRFIGNSLEIGECVSILNGQSFLGKNPEDFHDTRELTLDLAGHMIWLGGKAASFEQGLKMAQDTLSSGAAWEMFQRLCKEQGGDLKKMQIPNDQYQIKANEDGFITAYDTEKIGLTSLELGAGRMRASDQVDHTAGIEIHKKLGDPIRKGETLFTLYGKDIENRLKIEKAEIALRGATNISLQNNVVPALIAQRKVN